MLFLFFLAGPAVARAFKDLVITRKRLSALWDQMVTHLDMTSSNDTYFDLYIPSFIFIYFFGGIVVQISLLGHSFNHDTSVKTEKIDFATRFARSQGPRNLTHGHSTNFLFRDREPRRSVELHRYSKS